MRLRGRVALLTGAAAAIKGELMGFGSAAVAARHQPIEARARSEIGHLVGPLESGELTLAF